MDRAWVKIISVTGSVGVVALLLSLFLSSVFNEEIVASLGSERLFFILVFLAFGLLVSLLLAILRPKGGGASTAPNEKSGKDIDINYGEGSTHNGDNNF